MLSAGPRRRWRRETARGRQSSAAALPSAAEAAPPRALPAPLPPPRTPAGSGLRGLCPACSCAGASRAGCPSPAAPRAALLGGDARPVGRSLQNLGCVSVTGRVAARETPQSPEATAAARERQNHFHYQRSIFKFLFLIINREISKMSLAVGTQMWHVGQDQSVTMTEG